ncbi:MAG: phosphatidylglycerol lysyltransferase domain-containing protein [Treponema sp.]|nr:phosphatidylglycerol lysyltransferase domain-containing protein [Treponema sp.]
MLIPEFPDFVPISYELRTEMHPQLPMTPDGVSEYTFANLFLFRRRYRYRVSRIQDKTLIISGIQPPHTEAAADAAATGDTDAAAADGAAATDANGAVVDSAAETPEKRFFCTPCAVPGRGVLEELFKTHDYWKGISDSLLTPGRDRMEGWGLEFTEDRDNFDYLYLRSDLADLPGKKYHKKRNLVSQFHHSYSSWEAKALTAELVPTAVKILERWRETKGFDGDFLAASEALEKYRGLYQRGMVYWVEGRPAGWCLGERLARGRMFAVHFEKALEEFKGIYQFINQHFASALPAYYTHINREQDLGDEGLRQAKMTYRPCGFVRKFTAAMKL